MARSGGGGGGGGVGRGASRVTTYNRHNALLLIIILCSLISSSHPQPPSLSQYLLSSTRSRPLPSSFMHTSLLADSTRGPWGAHHDPQHSFEEDPRDNDDDVDEDQRSDEVVGRGRGRGRGRDTPLNGFDARLQKIQNEDQEDTSQSYRTTSTSASPRAVGLTSELRRRKDLMAQEIGSGIWREHKPRAIVEPHQPHSTMIQKIVDAMLTRQQAAKRKRPSSLMGLDNLDFAASTLDRARFDESPSVVGGSSLSVDPSSSSGLFSSSARISSRFPSSRMSSSGPGLSSLSSSPGSVVQRPSSRGRLSMKIQLGDIQRMLQRLTHAGKRRRRRR